MMGLPSEIEKNQIPTFVKMDYKNYISALEKQIELSKEALENAELPDISGEEFSEYIQMALTEGEELDMEAVMMHSMSMMPEIIKNQEDMIQALKTSQLSDLKETMQVFADAVNYRFFKALNYGFEGNARGVVSAMSNDLEMHAVPEIVDNNDGTSTYTYNEFISQMEVVRDNTTGDYISAQLKNASGKGF